MTATAGLLSQAVFEFGPLWLVALQAPAVLYGPYWAVLVSTLGIGGLLIAKLHLERWLMVAVLIIGSLATALVLTWTRSLPVVIAAQVVLALVLALLGIHASRVLHDSVPSSIRAGVSSGAGTLTWVLFLPFSLVFGWTARDSGIDKSGFMLAGAVVILSALLVISVRVSRGMVPVEVAATAKQEAIQVTQQADEMACKQLVELVADYLDDTLSPDMKARFEEHLAGCDGCSTYLQQTQQVIAELRRLSTTPTVARRTTHGELNRPAVVLNPLRRVSRSDVVSRLPACSAWVRSSAAHLHQRQAEIADLDEESVKCCLVGERAGNAGDSGVGVSTDIEAVKPGRPGVVEDALHQNLVAHCWLRVVRHLSAGCSSRRAQRSTSGSQHARAGRIGGRHPKVHMRVESVGTSVGPSGRRRHRLSAAGPALGRGRPPRSG